jgi:hypothetical protein
MTKIVEEKLVEHPLEAVFDIPTGTTVTTTERHVTTDIVPHGQYDVKDNEIEKKLHDINDIALTAYDMQVNIATDGDVKYAARNMEVANGLLNTALDAVKQLAEHKRHKDKVAVTATKPRTVNNTVIMSRSEMLKRVIDTDFTIEPEPLDD